MACYQWRSRALMATLIAVSVSACVPMQRQRAAYTDLCQSEYTFKVPGPQGETTLTLETYLYDHAISYATSRYKQTLFSIPYVKGPEAKPEFYVQLIAYNKNRLRPSHPGKKRRARHSSALRQPAGLCHAGLWYTSECAA
ncbi:MULTISPECIES: hypothetical protein [Symbiopectobacterium]|uniref:hypothetical protein n=1 Tax=Symbiopectobacterium TaxID=801 RepID=UPI0020798171|nr:MULTISPECIES: hypothetical protein [Symbiopectobacterium]MBT9430637.1 hypothetical protein [Candidatus Symbiopectobacterium endolongispinus]